jgi:hypothetical protein
MGNGQQQVTLDMSTAQPIQAQPSAAQPVTLDMSTAKPIAAPVPQGSDWWDAAKKIGSAVWSSTPLGDLSDRADEIQKWAAQKYQEQTDPAKTPNPDARATFGLGVLRDLAGLVHGGTSPEGAALTGATIAAPEIMGPALVAHGVGTALSAEGGALNPDALQQRLMGAAEAAGGAAATGQGFSEPTPFSEAVRRTLPGQRVSPSAVNVTPPGGQIQPALANSPQEVLNYAANKGIDLTPGQATNAPAAKTVQAIGERSLLGSDTLQSAREATALQLGQNVNVIADSVDPLRLGISEENAGTAIQQSARNAQQQAHDAAQAAYQQLPPQFRDATVDLTKTNADYFQKLKQAEVSLANRNPAIAAQIQGALEQGANLGTPSVTQDGTPFRRPEMTVQDLLKVRSDAIQDGNALARAGAPIEVEGIYRGLASDVDGLIEQQSNQLGMTQQWRQANAGWRDYQAKFNTPSSPLYQIIKQQDPAKVTRSLLLNGSADNIQLMQNAGMTDALQALQRQTLNDIASRGFKVGPDGLGGYSDSFLTKLFGGQQTKELYLNGEIARRMGFQQNPSGTSNVLLGMDQLSPEPSRFVIPLGAAKASMPRPAQTFLPSYRAPVTPSTGAMLGSLAGVSDEDQP